MTDRNLNITVFKIGKLATIYACLFAKKQDKRPINTVLKSQAHQQITQGALQLYSSCLADLFTNEVIYTQGRSVKTSKTQYHPLYLLRWSEFLSNFNVDPLQRVKFRMI